MKFLLSSQDIQNYKFIWNISKENYKKQALLHKAILEGFFSNIISR
ncbi:ABC transporter ATP-binding domain protein [Acinetobacter sp. 1592897]|nr:ABC transporter ATP-binding domain protein [Acinetobacter sp. 259052]EYT17664.1 ABC transporter ATP-binding domain protein [Acinetobacter sp. 1592897]KCX88148.1 ABC transporter ATP-binding domain protein [Acinetobacter baumannii 6112]